MSQPTTDIATLVRQRLQAIEQLKELTNQQQTAISSGHLSTLMQLLGEKQEPLNRLLSLSRELRQLLEPASPEFNREAIGDAVRDDHRRCEAMLVEMLAQEAACETLLQSHRQSIGQELHGLINTQRAARGYSNALSVPHHGASLDLSSDVR
jgi:flagellar biosynthesis/type III secretory pathway chaperone